MEKIRGIPIVEESPTSLSFGEGDTSGGLKVVELFGMANGDRLEAVSSGSALCRIVGLKINGEVCAGFPSPAEESLCDVISFDEYLLSHPESSFLLRVTGDSMIGAGIMEKDLVIVERGRQPINGDIVLAEVDGNWTMKYFRKKGKTVTLEAANPKYPPIIPQTELRIAGVITAVVRKYHR